MTRGIFNEEALLLLKWNLNTKNAVIQTFCLLSIPLTSNKSEDIYWFSQKIIEI